MSGVSTATLRSIIRKIVSERDEVEARDLARELLATYGEAEWWGNLKHEMFDYALYHEVLHQIGATRTKGNSVMGTRTLTPEKLEQRIEHIKNTRMSGKEWLGDRYKTVARMNRTDVLDAASHRRTRGEFNNRYAVYWESLAQRMDDTVVVEDIATTQDLDDLQNLINRRND
jgi:hypothetical protein|tara:strand:+ start:453 stop:968 length:516 start_codon:yes stop_codon:yes gene_type:complete